MIDRPLNAIAPDEKVVVEITWVNGDRRVFSSANLRWAANSGWEVMLKDSCWCIPPHNVKHIEWRRLAPPKQRPKTQRACRRRGL